MDENKDIAKIIGSITIQNYRLRAENRELKAELRDLKESEKDAWDKLMSLLDEVGEELKQDASKGGI